MNKEQLEEELVEVKREYKYLEYLLNPTDGQIDLPPEEVEKELIKMSAQRQRRLKELEQALKE